ncbi:MULTISPECIES: Fur family transcriptional regulator [Anaerosinus]|uniref:Fur family transcriptional regulator n=1 Tax=Selenobaculum gibii TaxID=3054208 RepID=A0A9Y2AHY6_9FIRM|nr:Fur family transcriptional regulator [Selenobaculum gbiensis]WIW70003.1 Fur family transcriptional regulator [Selenobaculum gbiensis]
MEKIIKVLRENGYKITPQRRAVILALLKCDKFLTVQQILDFVKQSNPDVSLDTVYRNLDIFVQLGLVHEIHTNNREGNVFELMISGHHHHLVCLKCGEMECMENCPVNDRYFEEAEKKGFAVKRHIFEVYGYCKNCKEFKE